MISCINHFGKFTLEKIFCEKYIWFEKVASWHDVRLHKDHSPKTLCSIISQSLCYASECMRIDVETQVWRWLFWRMFIILQVSKVLMSSEDKTLGTKLWLCVICNHNMKRISFRIASTYTAKMRNFYILYKWNGTNALSSPPVLQDDSEKAKMIHICISFCALNVKT